MEQGGCLRAAEALLDVLIPDLKIGVDILMRRCHASPHTQVQWFRLWNVRTSCLCRPHPHRGLGADGCLPSHPLSPPCSPFPLPRPNAQGRPAAGSVPFFSIYLYAASSRFLLPCLFPIIDSVMACARSSMHMTRIRFEANFIPPHTSPPKPPCPPHLPATIPPLLVRH
jgi:hypothetical protein